MNTLLKCLLQMLYIFLNNCRNKQIAVVFEILLNMLTLIGDPPSATWNTSYLRMPLSSKC